MPLTSRYQTLTLEGFAGGLNKDADPSRLEPDELAVAENVVIGKRGELKRRTGWTLHASNVPDSIDQMFGYVAEDYEHHTFLIDDDVDVFRVDDLASAYTQLTVDWTVVAAGGAEYFTGAAAAYGDAYFTRRTGSRYVWDASASSWGTVANMPNGTSLLFKDETMFCASSPTRPSGVYFSAPLDPTDWTTATDYIEFDPEDGSEVRGMAIFGDDIVVFKDHSIHLLTGKTETDFARYKIDSQHGCVSPRTIELLRGSLAFFDRDHGLMLFDGAGFTIASEKINNYILDGMNYDYAYKAAGWTDQDYYYLSVPWGTDVAPSRTFVLSAETGAWTEWPDLAYRDEMTYGDRHFTCALWSGMQEISGSDDDGTGIDVAIQTPWYFPNGPMTQSRMRKLELLLETVDASLDIDLFRDYEATAHVSKTITLTDDGTDSQFLPIVGWGRRFDTMSLRFEQSGGDDFQLNSIAVLHTALPDRRGGL